MLVRAMSQSGQEPSRAGVVMRLMCLLVRVVTGGVGRKDKGFRRHVGRARVLGCVPSLLPYQGVVGAADTPHQHIRVLPGDSQTFEGLRGQAQAGLQGLGEGLVDTRP